MSWKFYLFQYNFIKLFTCFNKNVDIINLDVCIYLYQKIESFISVKCTHQ